MTRQDFEAKLVEILRENKISYSVDYSSTCSHYIVNIADSLKLRIGVGVIAVTISTFMGNVHVSFMDVFFDELSDISCAENKLYIGIEGRSTFMTVALA